MEQLLSVENLTIHFHTYAGTVRAVQDVNFSLAAGEILGIVGESGCGKSVTASAILGLIPSPPGKIVAGRILFDGTDLTNLSGKARRQIRGKEISMIFQDSMTSLNPVLTIKTQLLECFQTHQKLPHKETVERAISLLKLVGIPAPETRLAQYPHQLSGGMRQRVMIAMALAMNPRILIADEPTTALDVTIQAQIIELLQKINQELKTSIILISHDLGVVAGLCHQVMVMYAGQMVETGPTTSLLTAPHHPYTLGLLQSVPRLDQDRQSLVAIDGQPPDLLSLPEGCAFLPRCPHKMHICHQAPPLLAITSGQSSRCWLAHPTCPIALPGRGERTGGQL